MPHKDPEKRKAYQQQYYKNNRKELLEYRATWAQNNQESRRESSNKYARADRNRARFSKIKSRYGLSEDEFYELLDKQSYQCCGCHEDFNKITPHVDHDHSTGEVRGLLCGPCNRGIGFLKENVHTMSNLIQYLNDKTPAPNP